MSRPLVSVILTVYNIDHRYLTNCIESILKQTMQDFEILIIDDASSMDYGYLEKLSPKIRYFRNNVNLGLCKSVNRMFSEVRGKYTVRLGSDDWFAPTMLEEEVAILERNPNFIACCCNLVKCWQNKKSIIRRPVVWDLNQILRGFYRHTGYAGGMMFRSNVLSKIRIDESLKICEDFAFHLELLRLGKIHAILRNLYFYRKHDTQITKKFLKDTRLATIDNIIQRFKLRYRIY